MKTEKLSNQFLNFCQNLKQLVALFGVLKVPEVTCRYVKTSLATKFRKERPAFCVDLQPRIAAHNCYTRYQSEILPLIHSDLTEIESKVAIFPFDRDTILQRLN